MVTLNSLVNAHTMSTASLGPTGHGRVRRGERVDVDSDGFAEGWILRAARERAKFDVDAAGYVVWAGSDARVTTEEAGFLQPGVQMLVRARNAVSDREVHSGRMIKRAGETHINRDEVLSMLGSLTRWQARINATHVVTVDAAYQSVQVDKQTQKVGAQSATFHDECTIGGVYRVGHGRRR